MTPKALKEAFARGENITELLRQESGSEQNTEEIIETAYDLQTGSYVRALDTPEMLNHKEDYGDAIAAEISDLTSASSILEPGVGEGTTMSFVVRAFDSRPAHIHGFDISWSRIACCRDWLSKQDCADVHLSVASILHTPYLDDSFDVVYTSHTIEPNGGNEIAILTELYRIASQYLILLEPGYELADEESRARMKRLGYCTGLVDHAKSLGMNVTKHELFAHTANPLNPTAITVIAKNPNAPSATPKLACPRYLTPLSDYSESLYSGDSLRAYPKINGIPCLRPEDGIIASTYLETKANKAVDSTR
jgi:ubiquinone/menaquinone biosynthesis C-methylase UbiE